MCARPIDYLIDSNLKKLNEWNFFFQMNSMNIDRRK